MAVKTSDLRAAAARVSSPPVSYKRSSGGASSTDQDWAAQQSKVARALVADTDLVFYFAYLVSNRACALAQKVAVGLSQLAVLAEGWKYPDKTVEQPVRLQRLLSTLGSRTSLSNEDVARIGAETGAYTERELAPQVARRGRAQVRGQEAASAYATTRDSLIVDWKRLRAALSAVIASRRFTQGTVRSAALSVPLSALNQTVDLLDQARLTDFTVQLNAAAAAVAAMGRPLDLQVRLRTGTDPFPEDAAVSTTIESGVVTTVTPSQAPAQLNIKSGDLVTSSTGAAVVSTVGESTITLASSTIPEYEDVVVSSAAYVAWTTTASSLEGLLSLLPAQDDLLPALQRLEGDRSAARIRALMEYLLKVATILDAPSSESESALDRVGGTLYIPTDVSVAAHLRAFAPTFGAKMKGAGDKLLSDLEAKSFDYAVEMLYAGQIDDLLGATAAQASRVGRVTEIASTLGTYTGGARGVG